jgi:hypothetical protein
MTDPERAAQLWLAVAVATLWLLSVGGEADFEGVVFIYKVLIMHESIPLILILCSTVLYR